MDRLWVKLLLFPSAALLFFALFLWWTFPNEELEAIARTRLEAALGHQYTVTFGDFGLSGLASLEAEEITLQSKPPSPDLSDEERKNLKRVNMTIDRLEADIGLFKTLTGSPQLDFEAELGGGTLEGSYTQTQYEPVPEPLDPAKAARRRAPKDAAPADAPKDDAPDDAPADPDAPKTEAGHQLQATLADLPLRALAILQAHTGAPLNGDISGTLLALVGQKGNLLDLNTDLTIARVSYGPGELPFDTGFGKFALQTPLRVGDLTLKTHVEDGKLIIDALSTTGPDLILEAEGNIRLGSSMATSRAQINARLKPSDEFLKKNDLDGILNLAPKVKNAKSGEWYGVLISGALNNLTFHPSSRTAAGLTKK
jgi:hypothetical protein